MKAKKTPTPSGNVFQSMVRTIVREEFIPIRREIKDFKDEIDAKFWRFEERINQRFDDTFHKYKDEVLTALDEVMGEIKANREERDAHALQHHDLNSLPERLDNLERIHPNNQHI